MNRLEKIASATVAITSLIFCTIIFYTMRNEHHETLDALAERERVAEQRASETAERILMNQRVLFEALQSNQREIFDQSRIERHQLFDLLAEKSQQILNFQMNGTTLPPMTGGPRVAASRTETPCPKASDRVMVALTIGQSNAGNFVGQLTRSAHGAHVVEFFQGKCYVAEDPLIGHDGWAGTPWVTLANSLIDAKIFDDVVIAARSVGGTSIAKWRDGGEFSGELIEVGYGLAMSGLPATHVLWVQGEGDRHPDSPYRLNDGARYRDALTEVINETRRSAPKSKFYVALASWCPLDLSGWGPAAEIRHAQQAVVSPENRIFQGPDLDAISEWGDRYDVCHLTANGAKKFSDRWLQILTSQMTMGKGKQ